MAGDRLGGSGTPRGAAPGAGSRSPLAVKRWGPLALLALVAAEIVVLIAIGDLIGAGLTVLVVVAVSLVGLVLLRREGLRAWRGFREAAAAGSPPGPRVTDGMVGLGGALLLAIPGLVTGLAGVVLLTPPVRRIARGQVQARAERRMSSAEAGQVFGPRRVRAERAAPRRDEAGQAEAGQADPGQADPGPDAEVVEGEIVDP